MSTKKTIDSNYTEVGSLFGSPILFEVPIYQRGYSWEREQVLEFCDDIFTCLDDISQQKSAEHFFGSIVCIEKAFEEVGITKKINILVDGQQRISTFVLFMSIVIKLLKDYCEELSEQETQESIRRSISSLENKYIYYAEYKSLKEIKHDKLSLSNKDNNYFKKLIKFEESSKTDIESNRLLLNARETILRKIKNNLSKKDLVEKISYLQNLEGIFNSCCFILKITTNNNAQAYKLFQILNDRGRALSAIDLLRANSLGLFNGADSKEFELQEKTAEIWDLITKDSTKDLESYFLYYYSAHKYTKVRRINLYEKFNIAFFENISSSELYKRIKHLHESIITLKNLELGIWPYPRSQASQWDKNKLKNLIIRLLHTDCLPLLLVAHQLLDEGKFIEILDCLEKFFFRYKTICRCRFEPAVKIYHEQIAKINSNSKTYQVKFLRKELNKLLEERTKDSDFISNIMELEYKEYEENEMENGNKIIKYLLIQLEENWNWIEKREEKGEKVKHKCIDKSKTFDFSQISIEHIYPQKPLDKDKDDLLEKEKNKLGNLTLLSRDNNSYLGNKSFPNKRNIYKNSSYKMNIYLSNHFTKWEINSYNLRTKLIEKYILDIFSF